MIKGKTAVVTGSSSGIGKAMASRFAAEGANVVLNGIEKPEDVEELRAGLEKEHGIRAIYSAANLMTPEGCKELIDAGLTEFGSVDILVNNAGIQFVSPVEDFPDEKWQAIINLNLSSAFYTTKAAIPGMKEKGWGRLINIASAHGLVASPFKSAYVAAKHGIVGFTKTVALELATAGVTANAICPGYVWTPLVEKQIPDTAKARGMTEEQVKRDVILDAQPTKEFVTVEEIADLACFLCSDGARNITGAHLSIDGGWTAE
ncbi:3-hydroxybutyrate dehydrogenase [Paroceanicella profunda]|uniref:3-hydroxybutyrate dehydrogenase n=1 Tax=Paroceanicella profunda TaxID=2579971 RepID=A0A5B8FUW8_9RHOB|nr:3-hydroxybutyrate dehydrogenase [Paroceanicella profunda]QDL91104.1 3-hydroxybutyrate dehydrogenase [Paroceanicella profunda]